MGWTLRGYRYWHRTPAGAEGGSRPVLPGAAAVRGRAEAGRPDGSGGCGCVRGPDRCCWTRTCSAPRPATSTSASPSRARTTGCWPGRPIPPGAEIYQLRFTEIDTGRSCPTSSSAAIRAAPGRATRAHFFYLVPDELNRPWQVWRHAVGTAAGSDVLVYAETDARFELTLRGVPQRRADHHHRGVPGHHRGLADPGRPAAGRARLVEPRRRGVEYRVDHAAVPGGSGDLLIVTDDGHAEFTLMRAPVAAPGRANWTAGGLPGDQRRPAPTPGWCAAMCSPATCC